MPKQTKAQNHHLDAKQLMKKANEAYAYLRQNPLLLQEEEMERKLWEATLLDGLEDIE